MKNIIRTISGISVSFSPLIIFILASGITKENSSLNWSDGIFIAGILITLLLPGLFMLMGESVIEDVVKAVFISPFGFILHGGEYELIGLALFIGAWGTTLVRLLSAVLEKTLGPTETRVESPATSTVRKPDIPPIIVDDALLKTTLIHDMQDCYDNDAWQFNYTVADNSHTILGYNTGDTFAPVRTLSKEEWEATRQKFDEWFVPMSDDYPDTLRCRLQFPDGDIYTLVANGNPDEEIRIGINISR
jgi:hypothetical protein